MKQQDGRDLTRFDIDFDLPEHFLAGVSAGDLPDLRPDLGDVSQGKLVTLDQLLRAVQRHFSTPSSWRGCGCW